MRFSIFPLTLSPVLVQDDVSVYEGLVPGVEAQMVLFGGWCTSKWEEIVPANVVCATKLCADSY